jgi:hypothetical protein
MSTIIFEPKDKFSYEVGRDKEFGIAISFNEAILFKGIGDRTGRSTLKAEIPKNAIPLTSREADQLHYEVKFAMDAIATMLSC